MLVQFPILIGLYYAFLKTGLPTIDHTLLYSFTPVPHDINPLFLGLVDLTQKSFVLALIAAVVQFIQTKLAMPTLPPKATPAVGEELSSEAMKQEFSRTIALQMRFIFPVIIFFIAYNLSGAIAIYLATGGIFYIAQELYVRRSLKSKYPDPEDLVIATTEDSE
jgi:membrane protein insertase Oxa1/YidC/SpoIIIJ